jgi:hypothetical protein
LPLWQQENQLFFGLCASLLAGLAVMTAIKKENPAASVFSRPAKPLTISFLRALDFIIVAVVLLTVGIIIGGGFKINIFGLKIRALNIQNPIFFLIVIATVRGVATESFRNRVVHFLTAMEEPLRIYLILFLFSVLFTFGQYGPYRLLYHLIPGFDGLRVATRFHILTMLSLAVLAGFGIKLFLSKLSSQKRMICMLTIPLLILAEYISTPISLRTVKTLKNIPEVYQWLALQEGDFAVVEYPIGTQEEYLRVYYSVYHWKKIVNGFSGYTGPTAKRLWTRHRDRLSPSLINDLRTLGVKLLIVHKNSLAPQQWRNTISFLERSNSEVKLVKEFSNSRVYELNPFSISNLNPNARKGIAIQTNPSNRDCQC